MRLWHKDLIPFLPRQQLLGQWRECCLIAKQIAEKGTPNHVLVNRVTNYGETEFNTYAYCVFREMFERGYHADPMMFFRHRKNGIVELTEEADLFPGWHNERYLKQCLANLQEKADCGAIPAEEWQRITDRWTEFR